MCKGGKREERSDGIECAKKTGLRQRNHPSTEEEETEGGERERKRERLIVYDVST